MSRPPGLLAWGVGALVLLVVVIAGFLGDGGKELSGTPNLPEAKPAGPVAHELEGVRMDGMDAKGAQYTVLAQRAAADTKGNLARLTGVNLKVSGKTGGIEAVAGQCELEAQKCVSLADGVELTWDQWRAELERADYFHDTSTIRSDSRVRIVRDIIEITGTGLAVDIESGVARIRNDVHATIGGRPN